MENKIPSDLNQAITVARYEILKYLRGKKLLIVLSIIALIFILFLAVPPAFGHDYPANSTDFSMQFLSFAGLIVLLCATFFGSDALVSEFQQRTAFLLFPNPVKRWVILAGKFLASLAASALTLGIFYALIAVTVGIIDRDVPSALAPSLAIALIYMTSVVSVAYFLSAYLKSTVSASILTFFLFFLILPIIDSVLTFAAVKPWFSLSFVGGIMTYIMESPYPTDSSIMLPMGQNGMQIMQYYPVISVSLVVIFAYAVISLGLAYRGFGRRDL